MRTLLFNHDDTFMCAPCVSPSPIHVCVLSFDPIIYSGERAGSAYLEDTIETASERKRETDGEGGWRIIVTQTHRESL